MIKKLLFSILSWVIAFNLIIFFRNHGQPGELHWPNMIIGANTAAIVVGIMFSLVDTYHDKLRVKRISFLKVIAVKSLVFMLAVFIAIVVAVFTIDFYLGNFRFSVVTDSMSDAFTSPDTLVYILYALVISFIFYFYKQLSKNISQDLLTNILLGKYIQPQEESRIFMFLDLTSATAIAEKLGAFNYSSFLQDFFYDLDAVMQETLGTAFQFVGDEVVMVWRIEDGVKDNNCIRFFFLAEKKINEKKEKYLEKYGVVPEFKAGVHCGKIVINEVGGSKKEIVYHGDTINTAARIRAECHGLNKKLLISAELLSQLIQLDGSYEIKTEGVFSLKGKKNVVGLISLKEKPQEKSFNG